MADENQVVVLRRGVSEWNAWRNGLNRGVMIDLSEANLIGANLFEANLSGAILTGANLFEANLSGAILTGANLVGVNLIEANLRGANLIEANLAGATLSEADLIGANLIGADLGGANLSWTALGGANLAGADLSEANLTVAALVGANLAGALLGRANLSEADLSGVDLIKANLNKADLFGAYLSDAHLIETNLSEAGLSGANLQGAMLFQTVLGNVDLSAVTGLETCRHLGPSIIDHQTLQRSGPLPVAFLRGVGLPDSLIDYLASRLTQMYSCFISYSSKDQEFAECLLADLQNKGVRCWFAPHDLPIGAKTWDAIDEAIKLRDKLLLVLSENAIASNWVEGSQQGFRGRTRQKSARLIPSPDR